MPSSSSVLKSLFDYHPAFVPGNVAVITGASSGIGKAMALTCAKAGMKVAMVDIDADELMVACGEIVEVSKAANGSANDSSVSASAMPMVMPFVCDVGNYDEVLELKNEIYRNKHVFGKCNVLMNNAGKNGNAGKVDADRALWEDVINTNMWGVINGTQAFLASMTGSKEACVVINTGSKQGITMPPGNLCYNVSKSAVKTFTEGVHYELRETKGCKVDVFLLIPGWTNTSIGLKTDRELKVEIEKSQTKDGYDPMSYFFHEGKPQKGAWMPQQVVDFLFVGMKNKQFYIICPDNDVTRKVDNARMTWTMQDVTQDRPPLSRWHPEWKDKFAAYMKEYQ